MNYTEITKFLKIVWEQIFRASESLEDFEFNRVLVEIHENYTQYWTDERILKLMNRDYQKYLSQLERYQKELPENEQKVVFTKYKQIKDFLNNPTFIDPNILQSFSSQKKNKRSGKRVDINTLPVVAPKDQNVPTKEISTTQRILQELNLVAWVFESQKMKASEDLHSFPLLHNDGRYSEDIKVVTMEPLLELDKYFQVYTERFERAKNTSLLIKELSEIKFIAQNILDYYHRELSPKTAFFKDFVNNIPKEFDERNKYRIHHSLLLVVHSEYPDSPGFLSPNYIDFGKEFKEHAEYNYHTDNAELSRYCDKLIKFTNNFNVPVRTSTIYDMGEFMSKVRAEIKIMKSLEQKKEETLPNPKNIKENPYPQVFVNRKGFLLFDRLYNHKKDSPSPVAEFSFIYRRLWKDGLLHEHQKPEVFRSWLSQEPYSIVIGKIKPLPEIGYIQIKEEAYSTAKELIEE